MSPFLISHPNRFRSADLGDSFPPGEAMVLPHQCVTYQFVSVLTKTDNLNWNLSNSQSLRARLPGHCEPVTDVTGVAISWIEELFLVDEFRETVA